MNTEALKGDAISYYRCSDGKQADLSNPAQSREAQKYAQREGWRIVKEFEDEGKTGTKDNRAGFQAAIRYALEHCDRVKALILYDTSRFARNQFDAIKYKIQLRDAGIRLLYVTQAISDDPDGEFLEGILELMDARYSKVLGRAALRGMKEKALRGLRPGGKPPYGLRFLKSGEPTEYKGNLTIEPTEAPYVKLMFEMAANGEGTRAIVKELTSRGITTKKGNPFHVSAVDQMLRNQVYKGDLVFNQRAYGLNGKGKKGAEEVILLPGVFPALVSPELWDEVQGIRKARCPTMVPGRRVTSPHVLTGLLTCAKCGGNMTIEFVYSRDKTRYEYYSCANRKMKTSQACVGTRLRADMIEPQILDYIYSKLLTDQTIEAFIRKLEKLKGKMALESNQGRERLESDIKTLNDKIDRLVDLFVDGLVSKAEYDQKLEGLKKRRTALETQLEKLPRTGDIRMFKVPEKLIGYFKANIRKLIEDREPVHVRQFLSRFIEEIRVDDTDAWIVGNLAKKVGIEGEGTAFSQFETEKLPLQDSNLQPCG